MSFADITYYSIIAALILGIGFVGVKYVWGLRNSPRELWLLYGYKFAELTGYKLVGLSAVLWLSRDCGMSDQGAGNLYSGYSISASLIGVVVGALIDSAGIKKVMLVSIGLLLFARFSMMWITTPVAAFLVGLTPMAIGFAMVTPLTSVAIKRYTTKLTATYGFSLFYVLMNLGFTVGNSLYDVGTNYFALRDESGKNIDQGYGMIIAGHHFSTYQLMFGAAFCATLVSLFLTLPIRDGVECAEDGSIKITPHPKTGLSPLGSIKKAVVDTGRTLKEVSGERFFWVFLGMIGILMFVKSVFIQWDLVLPKYCPRTMGEGARVGAIYNINTVLILFFVPLVTFLTPKVRSYTLMIVGTFVSMTACFVTALPDSVFAGLTNTFLGELVFVKWLGLAPNVESLISAPPSPFYWSLMLSFIIFTIGEAIWSPRFYQFTAEIAPKGREATYLSLAVLPTFASKLFVGPFSGWLLETYVPVDANNVPLPNDNHHMIWIWIGISAAITPFGMVLYKKFFERETAKLTGENASAL